jgi:putative transposase
VRNGAGLITPPPSKSSQCSTMSPTAPPPPVMFRKSNVLTLHWFPPGALAPSDRSSERRSAGSWHACVARNLTDIVDGFLTGKRFLLLDRDPLYTSQFRALLSSAGVTPIRLPASSPNLNAYAERFVRSIKDECLNKLVLLGENHLRAAIREYLEHYHQERNHQGLGGQLIVPPANLNRPGPIVCRKRLGGLLRFYDSEAA